MVDPLSPRQPSFDLPATSDDDGPVSISKLKATSESLRCFNDVLARIGEVETEGEPDRLPPSMSASACAVKSPNRSDSVS